MKIEDNVKLSVCIPVYNGEKFIEKTIQSIINQTFKDLEIIVIDNKSTDNTVNIVKKFTDKRIRLYVNEENVGMVRNCNKCLKLVNGKYINFVFADDILDKNCFKEKIDYMEKTTDAVMVVSNTDIINQYDKIVYTRKFCKRIKVIDGNIIAKKSFRSRNLFGEPTNVLLKKSDVEKIGEFNTNLLFNVDWEYWLRIAKLGKVVYINKALSQFRISTLSATGTLLDKTDFIRKEDKVFINSIKTIYGNDIKSTDIILHKFLGKLRLYGKNIFFKMFIANNY